jgi:uncharacterized RDD family membrane protein YckC
MQVNAIAPTRAPSFLIRLSAMVYELLLVTAVVFVASFVVLPFVGDLKTPWQRHLFQVWILLVVFVYFAAFWLRSGQTLAMKTWRIHLVDLEGGRISLRQAAGRFVLALLGLMLGGAGFLWALFDRDRQFLHDRLMGTRLMRVPRKTES